MDSLGLVSFPLTFVHLIFNLIIRDHNNYTYCYQLKDDMSFLSLLHFNKSYVNYFKIVTLGTYMFLKHLLLFLSLTFKIMYKI